MTPQTGASTTLNMCGPRDVPREEPNLRLWRRRSHTYQKRRIPSGIEARDRTDVQNQADDPGFACANATLGVQWQVGHLDVAYKSRQVLGKIAGGVRKTVAQKRRSYAECIVRKNRQWEGQSHGIKRKEGKRGSQES